MGNANKDADQSSRIAATFTELVGSQQATNGLQLLSLRLEHIYALQELPAHHHDPFDRALLAQAKTENMVLMSSDSQLANYGVELLW